MHITSDFIKLLYAAYIVHNLCMSLSHHQKERGILSEYTFKFFVTKINPIFRQFPILSKIFQETIGDNAFHFSIGLSSFCNSVFSACLIRIEGSVIECKFKSPIDPTGCGWINKEGVISAILKYNIN